MFVAVPEGQLLRSGEVSTPVRLASWMLIVVVCGVLLFRRRYPVAVGWCTALGTGGYYLLSDTDGPLVVVPIVALYAIAAQGRLQAAVAMAGSRSEAVRGTEEKGSPTAELAGVVAALVILGLLFGSRVAAAVPLLTALFAVGSALGLIVLASHVFTCRWPFSASVGRAPPGPRHGGPCWTVPPPRTVVRASAVPSVPSVFSRPIVLSQRPPYCSTLPESV